MSSSTEINQNTNLETTNVGTVGAEDAPTSAGAEATHEDASSEGGVEIESLGVESETMKSFLRLQRDLQSKIQTKIQAKLKTGLPEKIQTQLQDTIQTLNTAGAVIAANSKLAARLNEQTQDVVQKATRSAQETVQAATETAKHSIDQVLLSFEHRAAVIKESQDMAYTIGQKVLERAETVRAQIATNPMSPSWLKDLKLNVVLRSPKAASARAGEADEMVAGVAAGSMTETTASEAAEGMSEPAHKPRAGKRAKKVATEFDPSEETSLDNEE